VIRVKIVAEWIKSGSTYIENKGVILPEGLPLIMVKSDNVHYVS
jgi:hypothetical protein